MKNLYKKHSLSIHYLFLIVLTFITTTFYKNFWSQSEDFKDIAFKSGLWFCIISTVIWCFFNKNFLFEKKKWLRNCIVIASCCCVLLFTFKLSDSYKAVRVLFFLCLVYVLWKRTFIKPTLPILLFGSFAIFKILGVFWKPNTDYAFDKFHDGEILFLLGAVVVSLFYRMTKSETISFVTICFKAFLGLLTLNFVVYILYILTTENSFFCFFTFDKGYLPYYEILSWSKYKHPSYISWIILLIGGLGFWIWKEEKNARITTFEFLIYAILLLFMVFMLQARIAIIGYFLTIGLFLWSYISKSWTMKTKTIMVSLVSFLSVGILLFLVTKTSFFSDPTRISFFQAALNSDVNFIYGGGTQTQRELAEPLGFIHLHNDFICIAVDLGIIGLGLLLSWIIVTFYQSIKTKNNYILYTLLLALMFMCTDTFLYLGSYMSVWFITIFFMQEEDFSTEKA